MAFVFSSIIDNFPFVLRNGIKSHINHYIKIQGSSLSTHLTMVRKSFYFRSKLAQITLHLTARVLGLCVIDSTKSVLKY